MTPKNSQSRSILSRLPFSSIRVVSYKKQLSIVFTRDNLFVKLLTDLFESNLIKEFYFLEIEKIKKMPEYTKKIHLYSKQGDFILNAATIKYFLLLHDTYTLITKCHELVSSDNLRNVTVLKKGLSDSVKSLRRIEKLLQRKYHLQHDRITSSVVTLNEQLIFALDNYYKTVPE